MEYCTVLLLLPPRQYLDRNEIAYYQLRFSFPPRRIKKVTDNSKPYQNPPKETTKRGEDLFFFGLRSNLREKSVAKKEKLEFLNLSKNFHQFAVAFHMRLVTAAKALPHAIFYRSNAAPSCSYSYYTESSSQMLDASFRNVPFLLAFRFAFYPACHFARVLSLMQVMQKKKKKTQQESNLSSRFFRRAL